MVVVLRLVRDGSPGLRAWYEQHYSARKYRDGRKTRRIVGPGEYAILVTDDDGGLVVFRKSQRPIAGYRGVYLSCFRREEYCRYRASDIVRAAVAYAVQRWPGEPIFTFVDPRRVRSRFPGWCFVRAGWRRVGTTCRGLFVYLWKPRSSSGSTSSNLGRRGLQLALPFSTEGRAEELGKFPTAYAR